MLTRLLALSLAISLAGCGQSLPGDRSRPAPNPPSSEVPELSSSKAALYRAPSGTAVSSKNVSIDGRSAAVLPNGRYVTPVGLELEVGAAKPFELAVSPDGNWAATVNSGEPASVTLIGPLSGTPEATNIPLRTAFMGVLFSPDSARFYVAGGDGGLVWVGDTASQSIIGSVNLNTREHPLTRPMPVGNTGAFTGGAFASRMALTRDGGRLYVLDQAGFAVYGLDTQAIATGTNANGAITEPDNFDALVSRAATGRYPFGIALSPDDQRLYVSNVGILQFSGLRPEMPTDDANVDYPYCFPVQGYPDDLGGKTIQIKPVDSRAVPLQEQDAEGIRCGYVGAPRTYVIPPLGDPNAPEASSVFVYDLASGAPSRIRVVKTGALVGELEDGIRTHAGNHPNAIVVGAREIYVSNGSDDSVSVIDATSLTETARIMLTPLSGFDAVLKGIQPVDLALAPDGKTLYVAEPGLNAVGVIDLVSRKVVGRIPTGWWTSAVAVSSDGRTLYAASARGRGSGPNESSNGNTIGTFQSIPTPDAAQLAEYTALVLRNNGLLETPVVADDNPVPAQPGQRSAAIKHVVFIFKENAKYDYFMGSIATTTGVPPQRVNGVNNFPFSTTGVPNHIALAQQFSFSDNFYLEPVVSSDGHRWLAGTYTTEWEETNWPAAYGGGGASNPASNPETIANYPGRLGFPGSNGGPNPQDYNKHGGMFVHLARHERSFYNFGLGLELTGSDEGGGLEPTGMRMRVNIPVETVLRDNTDHLFPTYNTAIPDAPLPNDPGRFNRFDRFKQVFNARFVEGDTCKMPEVLTIYYPNDHGGGTNDIEENWTPVRFHQDNDAALGYTVELLSKSPCWKDMVIFVTEDDTQAWIDHVDGSRVVNLMISPYIKRQTVLKTHTSLSSMFKTAYQILGMPPLTLYDALATDLREMFTATPDFTPYDFTPIVYQPTGAELATLDPPAFAQAQAWARLSEDLNLREPDADEVRYNCALMTFYGLIKPPEVCVMPAGGDDDD